MAVCINHLFDDSHLIETDFVLVVDIGEFLLGEVHACLGDVVRPALLQLFIKLVDEIILNREIVFIYSLFLQTVYTRRFFRIFHILFLN